MTLIPAILKRRSVRQYSNKKVEADKLKLVLEAARMAPSAKNRQDWKFIVVRDAARKREIAKIANEQSFIAEADVVVVACGIGLDYTMTCGHPGYLVDVAIAMDHLTLQAAEEGLGTCWIGAFCQEPVRELLGLPKGTSVVTLTPLGYPADNPSTKMRKDLNSIVYEDKWGRSTEL